MHHLSPLTCKDNLLVVAHGNSLRGIISISRKYPIQTFPTLNLPTAVPYVLNSTTGWLLSRDYFLGDPEEIRKRTEAVAKQRND